MTETIKSKVETLRLRLAVWLRRAGDRWFAAPDAAARERGWQIVPRRGGLSRTYPDPRCGARQRQARHADWSANPGNVARPRPARTVGDGRSLGSRASRRGT